MDEYTLWHNFAIESEKIVEGEIFSEVSKGNEMIEDIKSGVTLVLDPIMIFSLVTKLLRS